MICPISLPFLRSVISEYLKRKNVRVAMVLTLQRNKERKKEGKKERKKKVEQCR